MGALEQRIKALGLEEKALANKVKNDALKAVQNELKAKSATDKGKLTKAELIALVDQLTS